MITHSGNLYRLGEDYRSISKQLVKNMSGGCEAPTIFKRGELYYWLGSGLTAARAAQTKTRPRRPQPELRERKSGCADGNQSRAIENQAAQTAARAARTKTRLRSPPPEPRGRKPDCADRRQSRANQRCQIFGDKDDDHGLGP